MATLTIGDRQVKVDDAFLSMTPEMQQQTVEEIASQLGLSGGGSAFDQATANASRMSLGGKVDELPSQRPSLGDEAMSFLRGSIEGIPVIGQPLADARRGLDANIMTMLHGGDTQGYQDQFKAADEELRGKTGGSRLAGQITGAVGSLAPLGATSLGGRLLGMTGSVPQRVLMGAGSGGALSAADTATRGGSQEDVIRNGLIGAGLGTVFPAIGGMFGKAGQKAAHGRAVDTAIKDAPGSAELKTAASALFENSRAANAGIEPTHFGRFASQLINRANAADLDDVLDGQALTAYQRLATLAQQAMDSGQPVSFSRLHNLRQIAQDVALEAKKDRTKRFAQEIVDGLDDLIENLKPANVAGAGGLEAGNALMEGISIWSRAKKLSLIEEAITKAGFQKSGLENGLRLQFQAILRNPKTRRLFSPQEIAEITKVANGTPISNLATLLGKFGFGTDGATNMLGGSIGAGIGSLLGGGLPGAIAVGAATTGARKLSEVIGRNAAERAAKVVATPNIPAMSMVPLPNARLAPALLPLTVTREF